MSSKKRAETSKDKSPVDVIKGFVAAGQGAQTAVEEFEDPEQIFKRFAEDLLNSCRKLKIHQLYFQEKKINPFHRLQAICQEKCLIFQDNFDKVAGMKAK